MKNYILIIIFFCFANVLLGQVSLQVEGSKYSIVKEAEETSIFNFSKPVSTEKNKDLKQLPSLQSVFQTSDIVQKKESYFSIKKNKPSEMAFFCDIEAKVEKASKLPVRFRLGDVQAVDRKEGKWQQFNPLPHISN